MSKVLHSYTDLLGETLIAAGFALIGDERNELIYLGNTMIKKYTASRYSLKDIRRYCQLYLLGQADKWKPSIVDLTLPK